MDNLDLNLNSKKITTRKYEKFPDMDLEDHLRHTFDEEVILEYIEDCMKMEINRKFRNGNTPLSWVVLNGLKKCEGKKAILMALIDKGANPYDTAPDHNGDPMSVIDQINFYFKGKEREEILDICLKRNSKAEIA